MSDVAMKAAETKKGGGLTGLHVLFIMLGFFGIIFAVNGVFLYNAITSFPGEDTKKSYLQGLSYNDTLATRSAQADLGWTAAAGLDGDALSFSLTGRDGHALSGRRVMAHARRAVKKGEDTTLILDAVGAGRYEASFADFEPGRWDIRFEVMDVRSEDIVFRATKTIIVAP